MATLKDLRSWMVRDLARFGKLEDHLQDEGSERDQVTLDVTWRFAIYTDNNRYNITAIVRGVGKKCYLGCISSSRKPRAGEDWTRGRDLADGDLSEKTWHQILADIVSYEMVRVHSKDEALRKAEIHEAEYPKGGDATRLTTGAEPAPGTADASRAAPGSSIQIRRDLKPRAGTAGARH